MVILAQLMRMETTQNHVLGFFKLKIIRQVDSKWDQNQTCLWKKTQVRNTS